VKGWRSVQRCGCIEFPEAIERDEFLRPAPSASYRKTPLPEASLGQGHGGRLDHPSGVGQGRRAHEETRAMPDPSLTVDPRSTKHRWNPLGPIRHRPRIYICALVMVLVYLAIPSDMRVATRALLAWNTGALLFIVLVGWMMARANEASIQAQAALEDENQWLLSAVGTVAACAALAAIVAELGAVKDLTGWNKGAHITLTAITIVSAWTFIHLLYTLHYAHEYYGDVYDESGKATADRKGLRFPGERDPSYGDFLYFAFVIGCASQTADVETVSPAMRRTALAHGIVAFFFNTVILALTINIGAGFVGS
jgi:uncharacterized membrane protein